MITGTKYPRSPHDAGTYGNQSPSDHAHNRERLDASAPLGVPAHLTVLAPFMPPDAIDTAVLTKIGQLFADITPFRFQLDRTCWFGDQVLWLASVQAHLPIEASVNAITLMTEQSAGGHWAKTAVFTLSAPTSPAEADSRTPGKIN